MDNIGLLKEELASSLSAAGVLSTLDHEGSYSPLDYRLFFLNGEDPFEQDGFTDVLGRMQALFDRMGFKMEIGKHVEELGLDNRLDHNMVVNGRHYVVFENFAGYGWGEAAQRFVEILNAELDIQGMDEQLYLIAGGNDGLAIFLTKQQFILIDGVLNDERWKPLPVERWCRVFEVDPAAYNSGCGVS